MLLFAETLEQRGCKKNPNTCELWVGGKDVEKKRQINSDWRLV